MPKRIVVFGATSALGSAIARKYVAKDDASFLLVGRSSERLRSVAADLQIRGATQVQTLTASSGGNDYPTAVHSALAGFAPIDVVFITQGLLPSQEQLEAGDFELLRETIEANIQSVMQAGLLAANTLEAQRNGVLVIIGSVAGDRARRSNYVYGAAKSATAAFAEGLRLRLAGANVHVLLVKPGPFTSPMTAGLRPGPFWSEPAEVADLVVKAIDKRVATLYAPSAWRIVTAVLRLLPAAVLRRLAL